MPSYRGVYHQLKQAYENFDALKPQRLAENLAEMLPDASLDWHSQGGHDTKNSQCTLLRHRSSQQSFLAQRLW